MHPIRQGVASGSPGRAASRRLLVLLALVLSNATAGAPAVPGWIVDRVLIDPALDNLEQRYVRDDPLFLGRLVTLTPPVAAMDDSAGPCTATRRRVVTMTPAAALATRLYRRASYQRRHPRPADLGLRAGSRPVPVRFYACDGGGDTPGGGRWNRTVSFPLPGGRLALIWEGEVVLVLAPFTAAIRPSFPCDRAASATERVICADPGLAGWDRSVAQAFSLARDGREYLEPLEDPETLATAQRAWIVKRDACGANRDCLRDRMIDRVSTLRRR